MPDMRFRCSGCDTKLVVDDSAAGRVVPCPYCGLRIQVPSRPSAGPALPSKGAGEFAEVRFPCPSCGGRLKTFRKYAGAKATCPRCGKDIVLAPEAAPPAQAAPPPKPPQVQLSAEEIALLTGVPPDRKPPPDRG